jgi:hypothetical protein
MPQTHHETHVTKNEVCQPSTGQEASTARLLGEIIPTALVGPAQQGREPCPIILPRIAIGVSVAPHVPVLPAGAPLALEHRATLVLTPMTNEEIGEEPGAHEHHPQEEKGAEAVEEPLAPPPKASPEQHQRHQWSPRNPRLFLLVVSSSVQSQTVPTTGTGHAPARMGEGTVTFYNAAPYSQTVATGTLLTGADGVEIVTTAPAVIPAGNPPIEGEVTVPAHATAIGPQGNIAPLDLNGLCCMAGISVKNTTAFHGGQDAYDYPMVTQVDIDQAAGSLLATLTPATQASLQGEIPQGERLAGPVVCQPAITPDHTVGSDASQVTINVSVTCHAQVYDHEAVVRLVTNALMQQATKTLGTDYFLSGMISTTITQAGAPPHAKPGTLTLLVTGQGVWVYQVSTAEQARLTKLIAGLSRRQAMHVLQQQEPGHLADVHIQVTGVWTDGSRLPADPARIHLLVAMGA